MNDYIKRKGLLDELCRDNCERIYDGTCHNCRMTETVVDFPSADVAEVRHGRWDENGRCTLCGGHAPFWAMASTYYKSPWCPACGARMDKEADHEIPKP